LLEETKAISMPEKKAEKAMAMRRNRAVGVIVVDAI
jgi:hypothetical protein